MSESSLNSTLSPLKGLFKLVWPELKKLHAERTAADSPLFKPIDTLLYEALERLGSIRAHSEWWHYILQRTKTTYTRPDFFEKPAIQEWLQNERVRRVFCSMAKDRLAGAKDDHNHVGTLEQAYSHHTGEKIRLARRPIELVLDVLGASLLSSLTPGEGVLLGTVECGFKTVLSAFNKLQNAYQMGLPAGLRQFKNHYLGTPEERKPFGGRGKQLQELNEWLVDETVSRRLLLVAEAGRGKSCLLAHWLEQLPENWKPVFIPISIRFKLSSSRHFFAALAAQFAELLSEDLPPNPNDQEDVYKGYLLDAMERSKGHRIVLVVDGLDEAVGWEIGDFLSPVNCPTLKVIVSCRTVAGRNEEHWLREVGWNNINARTVCLPGLDLEGVHDVLIKMGAPLDKLGPDVVYELHRLSVGDPLIIGFYVEELWTHKEEAARLQPEELTKIEAGFGAFFSNWMSRHHGEWERTASNEKLHAILAILACAYGPLDHADIESILDQMHIKPAYCVASDLIPIRRFIIGGNDGVAYCFSHPKLSDYIQNEFFKNGKQIQAAKKAFLDWGSMVIRELNSESIPYLQCPIYLLNHYLQHLTTAESSTPKLMTLVDAGWMRAREARDGGLNKFFGDVATIWDTIKASSPNIPTYEGLGEQVRCAMVQSSIYTLGTNLAPNLIVAAVRQGLMSQEGAVHNLFILKSKYDFPEWLDAFLSIGLDFSLERHAPLCAHVFEAVLDIRDKDRRTEALIALAPHLPEEEKNTALSMALEMALEISVSTWRADVLISISSLMSKERGNDILIKELTAVSEIKGANNRFQVILAMIPHLSDNKKKIALDTAMKTALEIKVTKWRAEALISLLSFLPEQDISKAMDAVLKIKDAKWRIKAIIAFSPYMSEEKRAKAMAMELDGALTTKNNKWRAEALMILAPHLPEKQRTLAVSSALDAALRISISKWRTEILLSIAPLLSEKNIIKALDAALGIEDEDDRAHTLAALSQYLPEEESTKVLPVISKIKNTPIRAKVLIDLSHCLPEEESAKVLDIVSGIKDGPVRAKALINLSKFLLEDERDSALSNALDASLGAEDKYSRAKVLIDLSPYLPEGKRSNVLSSALNSALEIENKIDRTNVLIDLSSHLPAEERSNVLSSALDSALGIEDKYDRNSILKAHVHSWLDEDRDKVLDVALNIENTYGHPELLSELIPYLSEEELAKTIDVAMDIKDKLDSTELLVELIPHLAKEAQAMAASKALDAALSMDDIEELSHILDNIFPYLFEEDKAKVVDAAFKVENDYYRLELLKTLAPHLPDEEISGAMSKTFETALEFQDESYRFYALSDIFHLLPKAYISSFMDAVLAIRDEQYRAELLADIAFNLPEEEVHRSLDSILMVKNERIRAKALVTLIPCLQKEEIFKVLNVAKGLESMFCRAVVFAAVSSKMPKKKSASALSISLNAVLGIEGEVDRAEALLSLSPYLSEKERTKALSKALEVAMKDKGESGQVELLEAVFSLLSSRKNSNPFPNAFDTILQIDSKYDRAKLLIAISFHLPEEERGMALSSALGLAMGIEGDLIRRARLLRSLVSLLPEEESSVVSIKDLDKAFKNDANSRLRMLDSLPPYLSGWLDEALDAIGKAKRPEALVFITSDNFLSFIAALKNGDIVLMTLLKAIKDTGKWWP